jgi:hypothetical protein
MWYHANGGPASGFVMFRDAPDAISVLEAADDPTPIGTASYTGRDTAGLAVWRLTIRGTELPGRWIILDREFRPSR